MQSRTRRYRARLKKAEATASEPKLSGGWGEGMPVRPADLLLVRRAIREHWDVSPSVREQVVGRIVDLFDDPQANPRWQVAACHSFIAMIADDQRRRHQASRLSASRPSSSSQLS